MASQVVCGCGLMFQVKGLGVNARPRCPSCGRDLKFPPGMASEANAASGQPKGKILALGAVSALAVVILGGTLALALRSRTGGTVIPGRPPVAETTSLDGPRPPAEPGSPGVSTVSTFDRQMLPSGPIR